MEKYTQAPGEEGCTIAGGGRRRTGGQAPPMFWGGRRKWPPPPSIVHSWAGQSMHNKWVRGAAPRPEEAGIQACLEDSGVGLNGGQDLHRAKCWSEKKSSRLAGIRSRAARKASGKPLRLLRMPKGCQHRTWLQPGWTPGAAYCPKAQHGPVNGDVRTSTTAGLDLLGQSQPLSVKWGHESNPRQIWVFRLGSGAIVNDSSGVIGAVYRRCPGACAEWLSPRVGHDFKSKCASKEREAFHSHFLKL